MPASHWALSRWHARRSDGNLRGWLYTILFHGFLNEERRRRRRGESKRLALLVVVNAAGLVAVGEANHRFF